VAGNAIRALDAVRDIDGDTTFRRFRNMPQIPVPPRIVPPSPIHFPYATDALRQTTNQSFFRAYVVGPDNKVDQPTSRMGTSRF
jgi:hypothetical protein